MSEIFITRRGRSDGGGNMYAVIGVEYPEWSTCTCTHTSTGKVLTAKDTSGRWLFSISEEGEWVVAVNNGTAEATKAVTVEKGKVYELKLSFWDGTLFENGNSYEAYTGGWAARAWKAENAWTAKSPTMTIETDGTMNIKQSGATISGVVEVLKDVDLTGWTSFNVEVSKVQSSGGMLSLAAVARDATLFWTNAAAKNESSNPITAKTYSVDISSVNGNYDLVVGLKTGISSQTGTTNIDISKIWLA